MWSRCASPPLIGNRVLRTSSFPLHPSLCYEPIFSSFSHYHYGKKKTRQVEHSPNSLAFPLILHAIRVRVRKLKDDDVWRISSEIPVMKQRPSVLEETSSCWSCKERLCIQKQEISEHRCFEFSTIFKSLWSTRTVLLCRATRDTVCSAVYI